MCFSHFFCYQTFNTKNLYIYIFYIEKQNFTSKYSFLSLKLPCQINGWKKWIPPDLGDSPRLKICFSPRSGGIPESSVLPDCLYLIPTTKKLFTNTCYLNTYYLMLLTKWLLPNTSYWTFVTEYTIFDSFYIMLTTY